MSRELKVRAWDRDLEIMVYSDKRNKSTYDINYEFAMNEKGVLVCNWHEDTEDYYGNFKEANGTLDNLMQYTGLKDKNGKEIYEGDILINTNKSKLNLGIENQKYLIVYRALGFGLKPLFKGMALKFNYTDLELIGNIYENPELLEGER